MPQPKSKGVASRLTAKVGPLPVWAWAAVILGAFLLWSRTHSSDGATSTDTTATPDTSADSAAPVPASGGGGPADNVSSALLDRLDANTSELDSLTSQILSAPTPYSNFGDSPAAGTPASDMWWGTGPAAQPTQPAQQQQQQQPQQSTLAPTRVGGSVAHATQTTAGVLRWGGLTFKTRAAFDSWARAHGTTTARELKNYPQARAIYSTLR